MRRLATIRRVDEVQAIEGADRIELAVVDGWKCVVQRGEFSVGQKVIYCEIDSFLPVRPEFEFLRKSSFKRKDDAEGFRLRTVKLRGQISQGLLLSVDTLGRDAEIGEEVTNELGIVKYEPPIPACLNGNVVGPFPTSIEKTDEERIQNLASDYENLRGKTFHVTEKLDGTSFTAFVDEEFGVCGRNWQYQKEDKNSYWQIAEQLSLENKLLELGRRLAIQGELVGPGIQKNRYKLKHKQLFVFNVFDLDNYCYLEKSETSELCMQLSLNEVPFVATRNVPETLDEILAEAEGKSTLSDAVEREGLVWVSGAGRSRISFKTISNKFLSKED